MNKNKLNNLIPAVIAILLMSPLSVNAVGGFERFPEDEMFLDNPHWTIAVVTVREVTSENTIEEGKLEVNEVLRGRRELRFIRRAYWKVPPSQDVRQLWDMWKNETAHRSNEWYERRGQEDWHTGPLETPKPEDKLIIIFLKDQDVFRDPVELFGIYRFSENNKQTVLKNMAPAERKASIQLPLLFAMLINPIGCFFLYISSKSKSLTSKEKGHRCLIILCLTLIQFSIYAFYESGISIWSNIRVDLLLVGSALLASIVLGILSLVCLRNMKENDI